MCLRNVGGTSVGECDEREGDVRDTGGGEEECDWGDEGEEDLFTRLLASASKSSGI